MLYARISRKLYIHGARSSRMIKLLAAGQQACMTVTLRQGLVLARSAFEHGANYESVVAFGQFEPIDETAAGRSGSRPHRCCSVVRRVNVAVWALVGLGHDRGWRAENEKRCRSRENAKAL
jgi:hypothetical protein